MTIIGGGLSGLHSAYLLNQLGLRIVLLEARDRLGGRIVSINADDAGDYDPSKPAFDLGPSWFWPNQIHLHKLINELGLADKVYLQYAQGAELYQRSDGQIFKGVNGISMQGSYRLVGGIQSIIHHLTKAIKPQSIRLNNIVTQVRNIEDHHIETTILHNGKSETLKSRFVITAMPPRLLAQNIEFFPALSNNKRQQWLHLPTWMANQAKIVIVYQQAFWKELGLSGDIFSDIGPLREIHDASVDGHNALCGFMGWSLDQRKNESTIKTAIADQLIQLFGQQAQQPDRMIIIDWAQEPFTASKKDLQDNNPQHGFGMIDEESKALKSILCSGAETASNGGRNNGYLEGALEASIRAVEQIKQSK